MKQSLTHTIMAPVMAAVLGLLCLPVQAQEEDLAARFQQANAVYAEGFFDSALVLYQQIAESGYLAPELSYNLGNAHFQMGNLGQAILHYERALKLDPGMTDAQANLDLANRKRVDKITPIPDLMFTAWLKRVYQSQSSRQWAYWAILLLWLAVGGGVLFLLSHRPNLKRLGFFGGISLFVLAGIALWLSASKQSLEAHSQRGIILSPTAQVMEAPNGKVQLTVLHEGIKVDLLEVPAGDWVKIRLEGADIGELVGFVKRESVAEI